LPRFLIERNVGNQSEAEAAAAALRAIEVVSEMEGVRWIKSYVSSPLGKIFCEYEAPSADAILEHARRAGLPADVVTEITVEVSPDMFQ